MTSMNIEDFTTVLTAIMQHNASSVRAARPLTELIVPMAWGDPGIGKTEMVEMVARDLGWSMIHADLATRDPA